MTEYTHAEKDVLNLMKRTDFKSVSKGEIISFASKLMELRPEVAKEVIAQFPKFVGLMETVLTEYKGMLDKIISSDDDSIKEYYNIANKEMDHAADSRAQFYDMAKLVQADCSKLLEKPDLPPETIMEILNRETEILKLTQEKDTEIRQQEREIEYKVNKKDSEKRQINWKLIGTVSFAIATVVGISASVLGGKVDFKLSKK